jgi:FtsX-like permease family
MHRNHHTAILLAPIIAMVLTAFMRAQSVAAPLMLPVPTQLQSGNSASLSPMTNAKIQAQVDEILTQVLARDYSVVDGWTTGHKPVKGIGRLSFVSPDQQDCEEIAKLGVLAIPVLALYVPPDAKPCGFVQLVAVRFLGLIGTPAIISPLGRALDPNKWEVVRSSALEFLGARPEPEATSIIRPILGGIAGNSGDSVLVVRSERDVAPLAIPIQRLIASLDSNLPVKNVLTMEQIVGRSTANSSFSATLVLSFAAFSLLLAAVGLYGVLAYLVTQRTGEIGIRMALGARREWVLQLVLIDGLRPALLGLGIGIVLSLGVTRLIGSVLYGTSPLDVGVFLAVIATLLISATGACLLPAWRAAQIDPISALRAE